MYKLQHGESGLLMQVTLDVSSKNKVRTVKLTRQRITLKPVTWQMCGSAGSAGGPPDALGKLAYVRVATFNKQTTESAKAALRQLKADGATRQSASPAPSCVVQCMLLLHV